MREKSASIVRECSEKEKWDRTQWLDKTRRASGILSTEGKKTSK